MPIEEGNSRADWILATQHVAILRSAIASPLTTCQKQDERRGDCHHQPTRAEVSRKSQLPEIQMTQVVTSCQPESTSVQLLHSMHRRSQRCHRRRFGYDARRDDAE